MDFALDKSRVGMSGEQILRRAGYAFIHSHETGKDSFVRRLSRDHYPRLHMYVKEADGRILFSLHLDQKQASYRGSHMHNAEYGGPVVEQEVSRLKQVVLGLIADKQRAAQTAKESESFGRAKWYQFWK